MELKPSLGAAHNNYGRALENANDLEGALGACVPLPTLPPPSCSKAFADVYPFILAYPGSHLIENANDLGGALGACAP